MILFQLLFGALLFAPAMSSGSGRHSLWVMASYISGPTPFPEFTLVLMLDDIQVGYCDSQTELRLMRVGNGGEKEGEVGLDQEAINIQEFIFSSMRKRLTAAKEQMNLTASDVHVQQRLTGCEVLDGQPVFGLFRDAVNSQDADSLVYNMTHFTYTRGNSPVFQWDAVRRTYEQMIGTNLFLPICVRTLNSLLEREKHLVMRRVRPRVRLLTKQVVGGAQLTCLATDFYPRHINLTLRRDGDPVDADRLSGGLVLPNGNGLYQMRKTLSIDEEELQRKHSYTCTASHLSLDNRLDVSWRAQSSRSHRVQVLSGPLILMGAAVILLLVLWRRRRASPWRHGGSQPTVSSEDQTETEQGN
ncbi:class I histocompatibility antigen, B alpha chain-like isoform 1-T1 [Menidia menidia]